MQPPEPHVVLRLIFMVLLAIWASMAAWSWMAAKWLHGRRVLRYEHRRPVPWGGIEALLLVGVFVAAPLGVVLVAAPVFGVKAQAGPAEEGARRDLGHAIERLLRQDDSAPVVALAALMAVVVAPIVEELIFRVVLQGWLEKVERGIRRRRLIRILPGVGPVAFSAFLFAAMHFRLAEPEVDPQILTFLLGCQAAASAFTLALALLVLRLGSGATAADLGFQREHLAGDVARGLVAWLAATGPVYVIKMAAQLAVGERISADPIPLFFLSLVLGTLYLRTHRVAPAIVMHVAFNATGLVMFALAR